MASPDRQTVDLSGYPDLVVIYLGRRVRSPKGLGLASFAPRQKARGGMFSARNRLGLGDPHVEAVVPEDALTE